MESPEPENLFRRQAVAALMKRSPGRPICAAPRPWAWLTGLVALLFASAAVFAGSATYARKETVRGWLVSTAGVARVASRRTATVTEIRVRPGDRVRTGDPLIVLSSAAALASGGNDRSVQEIEDNLREVEAQLELLGHREQLEREGIDSQLGLLDGQSGAVTSQQLQVAKRMATHRDRLNRVETLRDNGGVTDWEVLGQHDELSRLQQEYQRLSGQQLAILQQRAALVERRDDLPVMLGLRRSQLRSARSGLRREKTAEALRRGSMVPAPVDGIVATIETSIGTAIREGQLLLAIVPENAALAAEVYVPSRAIAFVERGGIANLAYDAFPRKQFGVFSGRIEHVSEYVLLPGDIPQTFRLQEASYKVRIAIAAGAVATSRGRVGLRPGMLLSAEIPLEQRSLADWLLEPLRLRRIAPG